MFCTPRVLKVNYIKLFKVELCSTKFTTHAHIGAVRHISNSPRSKSQVIVGLGNIGDQFEGTRHNIGFECVDAIAAQYKLSWTAAPKLQALIAEGQVRLTEQVNKEPPVPNNRAPNANNANSNTNTNNANTNNNSTTDANNNPTNKQNNNNQPVTRPPPIPIYKTVTKHLILVKPTTLMNLSGNSVASVVQHYKVQVQDLLLIADDIDLDVGRIMMKRGGGSTQHGIEDVVRAVKNPNFLRVRFGISQPPQGAAGKSKHVLSKFSSNEAAKVKQGIEKLQDGIRTWMEKGDAHAMMYFNRR